MRWFPLCCALLAGGTALAQPAPPAPMPEPTPEPAPPPPTPTPSPEAPPTPTDPNAGGAAHAPSPPAPPAPPVTVPAPVPKSSRQSATEARLAAAAKCQAHAPDCDWIATFSSLEKASIKRALSERGFEVEPAPWGKVIGRIYVHNEDVFAEKNWLRFFNLFHVTTREIWTRSEMTIDEGEVWDEERIIESQRRIKDPLYTSIVALVPVKSTVPGQVDLFVVTRDIWSLRLNSQPTLQEGTLTNLIISLSENNFLGRRKTLAVGMNMDQGSIAVGPLYIDKNWLRTDQHLDLRLRFERIFTRQALDVITPEGNVVPTADPGGLLDAGDLGPEGSSATISLARPLWSLASTWAVAGSVDYRNSVARQYLAGGLYAYDDLDTEEIETLPRQWRRRRWSAHASATRQWGTSYKHQFEAGYSVSSDRHTLLSTFNFDPVLEQHFVRDVFPRSEFVSNPFIEYSFFSARFGVLRNIDTYELAEDVRFGPNASIGLAQSFKSLGSDFRFTRPSATVGWTVPWGRDGFARMSAGGQLRIQDGVAIDNTATWQLRGATPTLGPVRFIGQAQMETRWNDRQNLYYSLGSESGLRAYHIAQFRGDRRFVAQLEARTVPFPFWVVRLGGVAFYEGGGAANSFNQMAYVHDVGVGARMLIPQSSRQLFRFDVAFPLATAPDTPAGYPRFTAGFDSYF